MRRRHIYERGMCAVIWFVRRCSHRVHFRHCLILPAALHSRWGTLRLRLRPAVARFVQKVGGIMPACRFSTGAPPTHSRLAYAAKGASCVPWQCKPPIAPIPPQHDIMFTITHFIMVTLMSPLHISYMLEKHAPGCWLLGCSQCYVSPWENIRIHPLSPAHHSTHQHTPPQTHTP